MSQNTTGGSARFESTPTKIIFFVVIFFIITAIYVGFHLFIAWIFTITFSLSSNHSNGVYIISVVVGLFTIIGQIISHFYHKRPILPITLISSILIGVTLYAFLSSIAVAIIMIPSKITGVWEDWTFLPTVVRGTYFGGILIPVLAGLVNARLLRVKKLEIPLPNLRNKPVKSAFISDLHLGLLVGRRRLERILTILKSEKPDIIFIGGDLFDTNPKNIKHLTEILAIIPRIAPTYAVTGNHEFINGIDDCVNCMEKVGITVIRNKTVTDKNTEIQMIGVDDSSGQSPYTQTEYSLEKLFSDLNPVKPIIFLNHSPLDFRKVTEMGIGLELSGHTHGGQLWPFGYITKLIYKDGDRGLITRRKSHLYVSLGGGTWGPPMRLGTVPEISILNLIPGKKKK
ncbi:MAG: metallophosphoesterase [Candidatus Thermoplasmatota archaeon]|nr:metallophosphoesterase [Candidatus Thermoplasmatota archaeon]